MFLGLCGFGDRNVHFCWVVGWKKAKTREPTGGASGKARAEGIPLCRRRITKPVTFTTSHACLIFRILFLSVTSCHDIAWMWVYSDVAIVCERSVRKCFEEERELWSWECRAVDTNYPVRDMFFFCVGTMLSRVFEKMGALRRLRISVRSKKSSSKSSAQISSLISTNVSHQVRAFFPFKRGTKTGQQMVWDVSSTEDLLLCVGLPSRDKKSRSLQARGLCGMGCIDEERVFFGGGRFRCVLYNIP